MCNYWFYLFIAVMVSRIRWIPSNMTDTTTSIHSKLNVIMWRLVIIEQQSESVNIDSLWFLNYYSGFGKNCTSICLCIHPTLYKNCEKDYLKPEVMNPFHRILYFGKIQHMINVRRLQLIQMREWEALLDFILDFMRFAICWRGTGNQMS